MLDEDVSTFTRRERPRGMSRLDDKNATDRSEKTFRLLSKTGICTKIRVTSILVNCQKYQKSENHWKKLRITACALR